MSPRPLYRRWKHFLKQMCHAQFYKIDQQSRSIIAYLLIILCACIRVHVYVSVYVHVCVRGHAACACMCLNPDTDPEHAHIFAAAWDIFFR